MRRRVPRPEGSPSLTDREEEIARRVRRALHLSASMSEREVARQFWGSVAWRRARMGLVGEEVRDRLAEVLRPMWAQARRRTSALAPCVARFWARLWS